MIILKDPKSATKLSQHSNSLHAMEVTQEQNPNGDWTIKYYYPMN
jgi:hypothetical protein